ncbi:hypothetical protein ACH4UM_23700 [Streptomyces sp. NPDC020801]|uniref:hypothetical protein n=1 Tax=Streptomyces sp. NPDC020801 TaxID=3365093 RepID=UPI003793643F
MTDQPQAVADNCEHHYETRILGAHPIHVRVCILCRAPDWADLYEQADTLFRWGRDEGLAGKPPRERLSAYDMPRRDDPASTPTEPASARVSAPQAAGGATEGRDDERAAGRREALRGQIAKAARTVPLHLGPNAVAMVQRGEPIILNMNEADNLADAVLAVIQPHLDSERRDQLDAALAALGKSEIELADTRAALARVRAVADRLAVQQHGVDIEADSLRRAVAKDIHAALDQPPAHNAGPTIRECAEVDRRWPLQKNGE